MQRKYFPLSPRAGSILKGFNSPMSTLNLYLNPENTHWKYIHKCTPKSHSSLFTKNHQTPSHESLKETPKNLPLHTPKYPEKSFLFTYLNLPTAFSIAATPSLQPFRAPKIGPKQPREIHSFSSRKTEQKKIQESFFLFHIPRASQSYNKTQPKSHTTAIFQPTKNLKRKLSSPKTQKATSVFHYPGILYKIWSNFSAQINLNYSFPKTLLNKSCLFVLLFSCAKGFSQLTLFELPWVFMFMRYSVVLA